MTTNVKKIKQQQACPPLRIIGDLDASVDDHLFLLAD
jgi:hypothetical protein